MWRPSYKQRCLSCKKNMVLIRNPRQRAICSECQMKSFANPVTDPKFIKLFDIPREFYEQSSFLRDVRYQYGRFGNLSEKQISAFNKVVKELTDRANGVLDPSAKPAQKPMRVLRKEIDPFSRSCSLTLLRNPPPLQKPKRSNKEPGQQEKPPVKRAGARKK